MNLGVMEETHIDTGVGLRREPLRYKSQSLVAGRDGISCQQTHKTVSVFQVGIGYQEKIIGKQRDSDLRDYYLYRIAAYESYQPT
jgi:hypothetical protein